MPHVSRKRLKKKTFARINEHFVNTAGNLGSSQEMKKFLNEVLTRTERTMLSKRLALIFMLKKGYSFMAIRNTLKVSPSTVTRIWKKLKLGSFSYISSKIPKKVSTNKLKNDFWKDLESILTLGLPPRGRGRWKIVERAINKHY